MGAETEVVPQNKHAPVPPVQQERPVQGSIPISDVRLPKSDALVLKADMPTLEQAIGKEKSQQYHQRITEVARQVDLVKDHSHFLTTANVDSYSKILSTSIIEISKALEKQDPEALEKALSKLESKLKILDKFITYEKTQGLVGTHAESGVRIYVKGDKVYLCTPDPKAFSDVLKNPEVKENLEKFVQAVTGGGIKSIDFAKFQNSEERDGVKLLSCRVDNINKEEGKSEFKLKTKVRAKNGEFEWKEISFTLKDLVGGALRNVEGFNGPGKIPEAHINTGNG